MEDQPLNSYADKTPELEYLKTQLGQLHKDGDATKLFFFAAYLLSTIEIERLQTIEIKRRQTIGEETENQLFGIEGTEK